MTRRLFLDKGLELFEEKGFAATTVDDISAAVGTTRATFYSHFPSKAQLMRSLVERSNEMLTEADVPPLHSVVESGDRELIRVWLARKFDQWADIRPMWWRLTRPRPANRTSRRLWTSGSTR